MHNITTTIYQQKLKSHTVFDPSSAPAPITAPLPFSPDYFIKNTSNISYQQLENYHFLTFHHVSSCSTAIFINNMFSSLWFYSNIFARIKMPGLFEKVEANVGSTKSVSARGG